LGRNQSKVTIAILADRPSAGVVKALSREKWPKKYNVIIEPSPEPVVGETTNWVRPLAFLHERIMQEEPEAILNLDDDQLFTDDGIAEIRGHLEFFTSDRYEYRTLFMWDDESTYNDRFPDHWSANLFRAYRHDQWATHFVQHCPEACARSQHVTRLQEPVVNFGYMDADVRADYWQKYKRVGKVDAHTLALIREPDLKEFKWQSKERTP
jgi:hypothetical protein